MQTIVAQSHRQLQLKAGVLEVPTTYSNEAKPSVWKYIHWRCSDSACDQNVPDLFKEQTHLLQLRIS